MQMTRQRHGSPRRYPHTAGRCRSVAWALATHGEPRPYGSPNALKTCVTHGEPDARILVSPMRTALPTRPGPTV
jgi:hypothetical protein